METLVFLAALGHQFMYVGLVQVDIVIAVELKYLQEAGRVCLYVCIWHDLAGNLWGVDVLGIMLL